MNKTLKVITYSVVALALIIGMTYFYQYLTGLNADNNESVQGNSALATDDDSQNEPESRYQSMEIIAEDLDVPWEIVFLPNGDILATERTGAVVRISEEEKSDIG